MSVKEKAQVMRQVGVVEMNESELSIKCRNGPLGDVESTRLLLRVTGWGSDPIEPKKGGVQSAIDYAVDPAWGNTGSRVSTVVVPAGTKVYVGQAANQGGVWMGGKTQVYIPPGVKLEVK